MHLQRAHNALFQGSGVVAMVRPEFTESPVQFVGFILCRDFPSGIFGDEIIL